MRQSRLFLDQIAATGNTMFQRDTFNRDAPVLIDRLFLCGINRIKNNFKPQIMGKELNLTIQFLSQCLWCMNMQTGRTSQKPKGGNHANQSETVVSMKVRDKDMTQFCKTDTALTQLHLCPFRAIQHQHLITHLHHLRRGVMTKGGKRASTP